MFYERHRIRVLLIFRTVFLLLLFVLGACSVDDTRPDRRDSATQSLHVSENGRFLQYENGAPFFWLGDTAWLLFQNLNREEANRYLQDRSDKGFNVIQVMIANSLSDVNDYGDSAFIDHDPTQPDITPGSSYQNPVEYDYWDHVDYIVDLAAQKGLYVAMVPVWGNAAKTLPDGGTWAAQYASWIAQRFRDRPNIIWLTGGDIRGDESPETWEQMGRTLDELDPRHLISFHPYGRTQSSTWFHDAAWLDFNMFQSGHRRYDQVGQDDPATWKGEDNWKYVVEDYALKPAKPTIDGEPSYENIPQGLHDPDEPYWTAADARRYAYWSVFAGSFGHTYGDNAVMLMHKPAGRVIFGVRNYWFEAIDDPGAKQMRYLKDLILSRPYFERIPDQSFVAGHNGFKYEYVIATRGDNYAIFYTYTGRSFDVVTGKLPGKQVKASWFNPRNGDKTFIGDFTNSGTLHFDPPGDEKPGNDWVLILDFHT